MSVSVTRVTTASGAIYDFLPDLSRVRRVSAERLSNPFLTDDEGFSFMELHRAEEWVRIVAQGGVKSPASLDVIRVGYPLIITLEGLGEGERTTRYTTPVVDVAVYEMNVGDL